MDGPRDYHTEWSKSDRERQISYDKIKHDTTTYLQKQTQDIWLSKKGMAE